jgi:PAS domain S-box-containing protein
MPRSDQAFARAAQRLAATVDSPSELEGRLRAVYPRTVVRERALSGEPPILYIYRDGRYEPEIADRWWEGTGVATAVIDLRTGTITEASAEWAAILGDSVDRLAGRPYTDFLVPEAAETALEIINALRASGEVTSEMLMRRADGTVVTLEFRAVLVDERIEVAYRPRERTST